MRFERTSTRLCLFLPFPAWKSEEERDGDDDDDDNNNGGRSMKDKWQDLDRGGTRK